MILTVVVVKDRAADAYGRPIFVHTRGIAIRSFQDEINRPAADNEMYKHPEDFDLYFIGEWDDHTAEFIGFTSAPEQIAIGKNLKKGP